MSFAHKAKSLYRCILAETGRHQYDSYTGDVCRAWVWIYSAPPSQTQHTTKSAIKKGQDIHGPQDPNVSAKHDLGSWHALHWRITRPLYHKVWVSSFASCKDVHFRAVPVVQSMKLTCTFLVLAYWKSGCSLGYASAWAAMFNLLAVFLPVPRSSFLHYLFNSDFSTVIKYHRWLPKRLYKTYVYACILQTLSRILLALTSNVFFKLVIISKRVMFWKPASGLW